MAEKRIIAAIIKEHKTLFIIILVGLFLIELEIFALAVMKSGRHSWLQVIDHNGNVIHETDGSNLSDFNKYYFEKTFGPFENYDVKLQTEQRPFPFRAWFVAAVGIPLGIVLLFGFIVKAYSVLLFGEKGTRETRAAPGSERSTPLERVLDKVSRLNIFLIGFLIMSGLILYWILPNLITYLGRTGIDTIIRFRWVFLAAVLVFLGVALWIIYLRYLLAKKSIESQTEVEKYRLELAYQQDPKKLLTLEDDPQNVHPQGVLNWSDKQPPEQDKPNA
jgi:hypothetical protein